MLDTFDSIYLAVTLHCAAADSPASKTIVLKKKSSLTDLFRHVHL